MILTQNLYLNVLKYLYLQAISTKVLQTKIKLVYFIAALFVAINLIPLNAQQKLVYAGFGPSQFLGDLGGGRGLGRNNGITDFDFPSIRAGFVTGFQYIFKSGQYGFTNELGIGWVAGNDKFAKNQNRHDRNLRFHSRIISLEHKWHYTVLNEPKINVFAGIGGFLFEPKTRYDGKGYKLRKYGTEGQYFMPGMQPYKPYSWCIPFGAEIMLKPMKKGDAELWLQVNFRKTFTDYIDDVHGTYADPSQLAASNGDIAVKLADRNTSSIPGFSSAGSPRGDKKDNDNFMFIYVSYKVPLKNLREVLPFNRRSDKDKDGVPDYKDKCENTRAGVEVDENGCPLDGDNDGVPDYKDLCPDVPGRKEFRGCPDTDGDGVPDNKDSCINEVGSRYANGCKDSDNDGIPDYKDKCPDYAGPIEMGGCPDSDKDGVPDYKDSCKFEYGSKNADGCKDSDNDGIPDYKDKCPNIPGSSPNGCMTHEDSVKNNLIGPGIEDTLYYKHLVQPRETLESIGLLYSKTLEDIIKANNLPSPNVSPGQILKIPMNRKEFEEFSTSWKRELKFAIRNIQFAVNSDALTAVGAVEINKIAAILKEHPEINIHLEGHTDSDGDDNYNKALSIRRAQTVMFYLVSKGIKASRITFEGFGETRPLAPNTTVYNKSLNRRVMVIIKEIEDPEK